jgi:hypothetical protein
VLDGVASGWRAGGLWKVFAIHFLFNGAMCLSCNMVCDLISQWLKQGSMPHVCDDSSEHTVPNFEVDKLLAWKETANVTGMFTHLNRLFDGLYQPTPPVTALNILEASLEVSNDTRNPLQSW